MRQQFARFGNQSRVAVEGCVSLARRFGGRVVLRRDIGDGEPLRFGVYSIQSLEARVRQGEETIRPFLDRRGRCDQTEDRAEKQHRDRCS